VPTAHLRQKKFRFISFFAEGGRRGCGPSVLMEASAPPPSAFYPAPQGKRGNPLNTECE
jgi:hypothetical protein